MSIARSAALSLTLLLAGCTKPPAPAPAPAAGRATPATGTVLRPVASGTPLAAPAPAAGAAEFAATFLAALKAGQADPAKLTPAFKKLIAPATFDADKARGYSDWAAANWLAELAGDPAAVSAVTWTPLPGGALLGVAGPGGGAPAAVFTTVRVVPAEGGKFLIDWVQASPERPAADLSADAAARFAAVAFVDAVLTRSPALALALLDAAAAKRLAPPLDDEDAKLGYNRGLLGFKLDGFRGDAASYTVKGFTRDGGTLTAAGELAGPGGPRPFAVAVSPAGDGWRVTDFRAN